MPIPGGVLVAGGAARCLYSATGMLRFLARLSGRRRHVRRSFGGAPGDATTGAVSLFNVEPSSSSSPSSCCFTTSTTTTTSLSTSPSPSSSSSSSSNEAISKDLPLLDQTVIDPIRMNDNLDLDDIILRKCYLRCRRNIHSESHQERIKKLSTCTEERLIDPTSTSSTTTTATTTTLQQTQDDRLSRITGLCDSSTTAITRTQRQEYLEQMDNNNINKVSSKITNNTSSNSGIARYRRRRKIPSYLATLLVISYTLFGIAEACSSRSTPKPRPPASTPRPNITFPKYICPQAYMEYYCLNGGTCFSVRIQGLPLYSCQCANGFIGLRCEYKDLEGSYFPSRKKAMLETASIAGGATIAVFLVVIICIAAYIHYKRKQKEMRTSSTCGDTVDGPVRDPELRPFSNRNRPIMTFMAKNSNCTAEICPSIEQTRMPGWNDYSQVELTRLASINEAKR